MIRITRTVPVPGQPNYTIDPDTAELRAVLDAMRSWSRISELTGFAELRHGYGNSDGGFGTSYEGDLDDSEREGSTLVDGMVMVYGFFGPPDGYEYLVSEAVYLECLAAYLRANDRVADAVRVEAIVPR